MKTLTTPTPSKFIQQTEYTSSKNSLEIFHTQFIRWALTVTASGECSGDIAIALLDRAWAAQKLLWSLRD